MDERQKKILLKSQQGELDAVPMYLRLADVTKEERHGDILKEYAAGMEGRR